MSEKKNKDWKVLLKLDDNYTLMHNPKNPCQPYNVAHLLAEDNSWAHGHYNSTLRKALKEYLEITSNLDEE